MGRLSRAKLLHRERSRARRDPESRKFVKDSDRLKREHLAPPIDLTEDNDDEPELTDDDESDAEELESGGEIESTTARLVEEGDIWMDEYFLHKQKEMGSSSLTEQISTS